MMLRTRVHGSTIALFALAACSSSPAPGDGAMDASASDTGTEDRAVSDVVSSDLGAMTDGADPDGTPSDSGADGGVTDSGVDAGAGPVFGLDSRPSNTSCRAFARPSGTAGVRADRALTMQPTFSNVTEVQQAPGNNDFWYFVEKIGRVRRVRNDGAGNLVSTFVDISSRVNAGPNEAGLLGMAFHPRFAMNGYVYLSYTRTMSGLQSVISRFVSRDGGQTLDPSSETILLTQAQPFDNHNGGQIAFGPDGMLYIALGDGGSAGDPMNHAQNVSSLLGKILRIDVDRAGMGTPYAIPSDNPFVGRSGFRAEIWAYGLRNPWKFSFDTRTGELWTGDVGQGALEEVDVIRPGGNYGWRIMEGTRCYNPSMGCNMAGLQLPVLTYPRSDGVSITGGYVYRGSAIPSLQGRYIFGDFGSSRVWAVQYDAMGVASKQDLFTAPGGMATFAQDQHGEVYVVTYNNGLMYRINPTGAPPMDAVPRTLSATGCFMAGDVTRPAPGVIPYTVNAPLWSDGAEKERFFAIPDGSRITVNAEGDFEFPNGTVLIKTFSIGGRRVETRLFVRHMDGVWAGYTYAYNAAGTDADLLQANETRMFGAQRWYYPSRSECLSCHTPAAGFSLGLELAQLNGPMRYPSTGRTANQLDTLERVGYFAAPLPAMRPALATYTGGSFDLAERARAYLHANCSSCHRPDSTGRGNMDLRYGTPFAMTHVCNAAPSQGDLGVTGARVLLPGDAARSLLSLRMQRLDANRMPPLATSVVDVQGTTLINGWIRLLAACP
jgi:uncharacterized repeat protein (TIGR03806 family)